MRMHIYFCLPFLCMLSVGSLCALEFGIERSLEREVVGQASMSTIQFGETVISGLGMHAQAGLFVTKKVSFHAGYFSMADATGSTVLSGFDATMRWFLFSPGSSVRLEGDGKSIYRYSSITHYALVSYRLRQLYTEETTPQFSGFSVGYGMNWFLGRTFSWSLLDKFFANIEIDAGKLSEPLGTESQVANVTFGMGLVF